MSVPLLTEKERRLKQQLSTLQQQIDEKQSRHVQLQHELAKYPSVDELNKKNEQLAKQLEEQKQKLSTAQTNLSQLKSLEERVMTVAGRVQRLEAFCARSESWIRDTLAKDVEASITAEEQESEARILAVVKKLQARRDEQLQHIYNLKEKVREKATLMKRGGHKDPVHEVDGFELVETLQSQHNERAVTSRAEGHADYETMELDSFNKEVQGELETLQEKLKKLVKHRSMVQVEATTLRQKNKREEQMLLASIRQLDLQIARDQRLVGQLNTSNASLTSTLQMVMSQLNLEHYGAQGGPMNIEVAQRREASRSLRATQEGLRITDKPQ